jgi:hypothetical protein
LAGQVGNPPSYYKFFIGADHEKKRVVIKNDLFLSDTTKLLVEEISEDRVRKEVAEFLTRLTRV